VPRAWPGVHLIDRGVRGTRPVARRSCSLHGGPGRW
jgi:hypothetical protein